MNKTLWLLCMLVLSGSAFAQALPPASIAPNAGISAPAAPVSAPSAPGAGVSPSEGPANPFRRPSAPAPLPSPESGQLPGQPIVGGLPAVFPGGMQGPGAPPPLVKPGYEPIDEEVQAKRIGLVNGMHLFRGVKTYEFQSARKHTLIRRVVTPQAGALGGLNGLPGALGQGLPGTSGIFGMPLDNSAASLPGFVGKPATRNYGER